MRICKVSLNQTVYEAALERIRWLFDEFEVILLNMSGGKDSTVVFNLSLQVAREKGRLPLKVLFIDQEAEWDATIHYVRNIMNHPDVEPLWLQVPIKIFNATSHIDPWLYCWDPNKEWIREKEHNSIKENDFGTMRFAELFDKFSDKLYANKSCAHIAGVRCEESPARRIGLTQYETYKGETWGNKHSHKNHFNFYPIYDWSYSDVWKAIHDNEWKYCRLYDYMYQYGIPVMKMRVSNVHHETAVRNLFFLQEIEPENWEKIVHRISGINTAGQLAEQFNGPKTLPPMFSDWWEYRDYLLENLIVDKKQREIFRNNFNSFDMRFKHDKKAMNDLIKTEIQTLLVNDYHGTKLRTFDAGHLGCSINRGKRSGRKY